MHRTRTIRTHTKTFLDRTVTLQISPSDRGTISDIQFDTDSACWIHSFGLPVCVDVIIRQQRYECSCWGLPESLAIGLVRVSTETVLFETGKPSGSYTCYRPAQVCGPARDAIAFVSVHRADSRGREVCVGWRRLAAEPTRTTYLIYTIAKES